MRRWKALRDGLIALTLIGALIVSIPPTHAQTQTDARAGLGGSVAIKPAVDVASTAEITTFPPTGTSVTSTIDGVSLTDGMRVLYKDESTDATLNGIWVVDDTDEWQRATDFNGPRDITCGTMVMAVQGTANANTIWFVDCSSDPTIGTDTIAFSQLGSLSATSLGQSLIADATTGDMWNTLGFSAAVQTILDDTAIADIRTTLGLGTLAVLNSGTSAGTACLMNANCTPSGNWAPSGDWTPSAGDWDLSSLDTLTLPGSLSFTTITVGTPDGSPASGEVNAEGYLVNGINVIRIFTATPDFFDDDSTTSFTHSLGCTPDYAKGYLVNATAEKGYTAGEKVDYIQDNDTDRACSTEWNSLTVDISCGTTVQIMSKLSFNSENITEANWKLGAVAWCFNP